MESGVATEGGASYVPQIARAVQTAPVIAPGAFPDGQPGTQYTATVSPSELKAAEEEATRFWERTEAERQKTKEREAAEALQKCQEEGGCGAEGEGPGEETFGDPIHCYVGGEVFATGSTGFVNGVGGCSQGLPQGTWITGCVGALPDLSTQYSDANCKQRVVEHHTSRYWAMGLLVGVHCEEGELIRGYVAFWVPGGKKTLYAGTKEGEQQAECGDGSGDEVSEFAIGLWPMPDLPTDLASLWYIFHG
jgi:hypothetical protein